MGMKLFNDGGSDSDGGADDLSKIEIDEEFARRYEHNKKREDLQRFEELKKKGVIDSDRDSDEDDESSEDEANIVNYSSKQDLKFFDALIKVRKQDPSLKDKDAKLFDSDNEDDEDDEADDNKEKKKKPMYLKDVTAKHLIEKGPEFDDEDEDEEEENKNKKKSYFEEQEVFRKAVLDAVDDEDDEGDLLKVKNDKREIEDEDEGEYEKKLNEYFQEDEKLDENEKFLKDYFRKKMWLDNESGNKRSNNIELDVSEDEEELERQEEYEREFNFRFEENAGDRVMGFSRKVDGSVRKKDNARKIQRKNKEERIAQADFERKEELKHMKNLKKKEMNEKLKKIRETAGIGENEVCLLDEHDLEEEFDPEEYDKKMKKAFDDNFYEAEDINPEFGTDDEELENGDLKKPNFDEEDDFLGLPKGWEDEYEHKSGDGFLATRERTLKGKSVNTQPQDKDETIPDKKKKRKISEVEKEVINKELEEYYKLDYEDTIGDLKTRFKYRPVNKNNYGLKAKDILVVDDKELNQLIPLKKLATYREDEFIVPRHKIKEQKQRIKSLIKGETSEGVNNGRKMNVEKSSHVGDDVASEKTENEDGKVLSRKQRRKKKLSEFKLPPSRLLAYQKITAKSKKSFGQIA
ncbi:hypothetical protein LXL04_011296 [Taraxacum kok-saghyz]